MFRIATELLIKNSKVAIGQKKEYPIHARNLHGDEEADMAQGQHDVIKGQSTPKLPPAQRTLLTAEDLWKRADDGYRYELVKGELRKMLPAGDS